jgi:tetratricopeptide (TPR) repeat protein
MRLHVWGVVVWCGAILLGCASPATAPLAVTEAPADQAPRTAFEKQYRERAVSAARQGKLAEAAQSWEILVVMRPESREYREQLAELRRQIDAATTDRAQRAARAQQRGEIEAATQLYLAVLALKPDYPQAADALRALERERLKRQQLGRPSRYTLTRRTAAEGEMALAPSGGDRNDLEHAALLAGQGELDDAIALLERRVSAQPRDDAARQSLADLYQQKAEVALAARDPAAATVLLEKSLRLDPGDRQAAERLQQVTGLSPAAAAAAARPAPSDSRIR